ncbi:SBBP repeat-containing protein [Fluviicola sp.]|uniref:SBBP repeat-containing protein n=1 Tax=Fluviicola sp. TaxID=1917219 RepID=UPI0031DB7C45
MIKHLTSALFILLFLATSPLHAQNFGWAKSFGNSNYSQEGMSITTDASGNVYTTGKGKGTIDFDPGSGVNNLTLDINGDIYIQKLDANGNFLWARSFGFINSIPESGYAIITDPAGNVYTLGVFFGTVDFNPGPGTYNLTAVNDTDLFLLKLDPNGTFIWAKSFGATGFEYAYDLELDHSGNIYIVGTFSGTADLDPHISGVYSITATGAENAFIQKLDADGNFLWAKTFGGDLYTQAASIAIDQSGNSYTAGAFAGTTDFDPGTGTNNTISVQHDAFVVKLDPSGNFVWVRTFGGPESDYATSIDLDALGNVYTTGTFIDTADFDPGTSVDSHICAGGTDAFVQKLDSAGNFLWARTYGGYYTEYLMSMDVDLYGNVYTQGVFNGSGDFDPGSGTTILNSGAVEDFFIQKLSTNGNFLWAQSFGGSSQDWGHDLHVDELGRIYSTGFFGQTVDFDKSPAVSNLTAIGSQDAYILKLFQSEAGIEELNPEIQLTVFPNPSHGATHLSAGKELTDAELFLTDIQGKVVWTASYDSLKNATIQLPETSGIYFLHVKTKEGQQTVKVVRE